MRRVSGAGAVDAEKCAATARESRSLSASRARHSAGEILRPA
jgi:hypothetical protein